MDSHEARQIDPWFWSHYDTAAGIVISLVPVAALQRGSRVVDFGCGDGATALGFATKTEATVIGLDLYRTFEHLPGIARENLGAASLPSSLSFRQNTLHEALPLPDESIDLAYSWSVFEHLADVRGVVSELRRILSKDGALFIQVEPLFYSPFGSHLRRLVDEPWGHLLRSEDKYLALALGAKDHVRPDERDVLHRTHAFEDTKRHLVEEYRQLNRITADDIFACLDEAKFAVAWKKLIPTDLEPPAEPLRRFPRDVLVTEQIVVLATKR
jgi:ubiquinone/menaquinone biosynthesis C-methylase UbiE